MSPEAPQELDRGPIDASDLAALAALRTVFEANDPVPAGLAERAKFAMTVAALEAEVASIVTDEALAGLRVTDYDRASTITFAGQNLSAMVSFEPSDGQRARVVGWVTGGHVEVELRERSRTRVTTTDSEGRFGFDVAERGLVHFLFRSMDDPGSTPLITPAIEI